MKKKRPQKSSPTSADPARIARKGDPTSADDPLWEIISIVTTDEATDVSENKLKYLAEAYADLHDSSD